MVQPDPDLSAAARDVLHELEAFARVNPEASAPVIAWFLAMRFCAARLKRKYRPGP